MLTIHQYLTIIEQAVASIRYPKQPDGLYAPIRYTLEGGGKRLRPMLTLASCQAFGVEPETAINQAVGIEMFHNFTLLHDDVMDRADMRRGRATVHVRWNDSTAILSGDAMLTLAGMLVARECPAQRLNDVTSLFNRTAMEIYEGQQYDMDFEQRTDVTVAEYMEMIRLKTSVLLGCACRMGAIMADAEVDDQKAIYRYGEKLGLAFQLRDDFLDTYGDPIVFGKEIGGDILNDKKTWLLITALAEDTTGVLLSEISHPSLRDEKIARVRAVYDRLDLAARCNALVDTYVSDAIAELGNTSMSHSAKTFFTEIAEQSRTRIH